MTPNKSVPQIKEILSNSDEHTDIDQEMVEDVNNKEDSITYNRKEKILVAKRTQEVSQSDSGEQIVSDSCDNEESSGSYGQKLHPRHRGRREKERPRRSFEQDMYQEREETSDERKKKILRQGRATKRYEQDDDSDENSSDDDFYDHDEHFNDKTHSRKGIDLRRSRDRGRRRKSPSVESKQTGSYRRNRHGNDNGDDFRYSKRNEYSDVTRRGYRNKTK